MSHHSDSALPPAAMPFCACSQEAQVAGPHRGRRPDTDGVHGGEQSPFNPGRGSYFVFYDNDIGTTTCFPTYCAPLTSSHLLIFEERKGKNSPEEIVRRNCFSSTKGNFAPRGHLARSGDNFNCHNPDGWETGIQWAEPRAAAKHPTTEENLPKVSAEGRLRNLV